LYCTVNKIVKQDFGNQPLDSGKKVRIFVFARSCHKSTITTTNN
jgi:hypothetical protein